MAKSSNKARFDTAKVIQEAVDHIFMNEREWLATAAVARKRLCPRCGARGFGIRPLMCSPCAGAMFCTRASGDFAAGIGNN